MNECMNRRINGGVHDEHAWNPAICLFYFAVTVVHFTQLTLSRSCNYKILKTTDISRRLCLSSFVNALVLIFLLCQPRQLSRAFKWKYDAISLLHTVYQQLIFWHSSCCICSTTYILYWVQTLCMHFGLSSEINLAFVQMLCFHRIIEWIKCALYTLCSVFILK